MLNTLYSAGNVIHFGETWSADGKNENHFTPIGMRINFFTTVALYMYIQLFLYIN